LNNLSRQHNTGWPVMMPRTTHFIVQHLKPIAVSFIGILPTSERLFRNRFNLVCNWFRSQGIWVTPSDRLPLLVHRPCGSQVANVPKLINTRHSKSFSWSWREWRPDQWRHERPWWPSAASVAPQTQTCGGMTGAPKRRPAANRTEALSISKPTEDSSVRGVNLLTPEIAKQEGMLYQLGQ